MVTPSSRSRFAAAAAAPAAPIATRPRSSTRISRRKAEGVTTSTVAQAFRTISEHIEAEAACTKAGKRRKAISPLSGVFYIPGLFSKVFSFLHPDLNPNNSEPTSLYYAIRGTFYKQSIKPRKRAHPFPAFNLICFVGFLREYVVKAWLDRAPKKFNKRKSHWSSTMLITSDTHPLSGLHSVSNVCKSWDKMCVPIRLKIELMIREIRWNVLVRIVCGTNMDIANVVLLDLIRSKNPEHVSTYLKKCKQFHPNDLNQIVSSYSRSGLLYAISNCSDSGFSMNTTWDAYHVAVAIANRVYEFIKENRLYLHAGTIPPLECLIYSGAPLGFDWLLIKIANETDFELKNRFLIFLNEPCGSVNLLIALVGLKRENALKIFCDSFPDLAKHFARSSLKGCIQWNPELDALFAYLESKDLLELSKPSPEFEWSLAQGHLPLTQAAKAAKLPDSAPS